MSGREWKPGDVAFDPTYGVVFVVPYGMGCHPSHEGRGLHTHLGEGDWNGLPDRLRPLVVIDPEDREQVERLTIAFMDKMGADDADDMADALREFANPTPPKPDEPTGLGAVVEDSEGVLWVRAGKELQTPDHWRATSGENLVGWWATWERIDAVRVLSEGVTP